MIDATGNQADAVYAASKIGTRAYAVFTIVVALVLMTSAALKIIDFGFDPAVQAELFFSPIFFAVLIAMELVVCCWLFFGKRGKLQCLAVAIMFAVFAIYGLFLVFKGRTVCGCFGKASFPLTAIIVVDAMFCLAAFLFYMRLWRRESGVLFTKSVRTALFLPAIAVIFLSVGLFAALGYANQRTETGHIELTPFSQKLEGLIPGKRLTGSVQISNHSTTETAVVAGGRATCGSTLVTHFPFRIDPGESKTIEFCVVPPCDEAGLFRGRFVVWLDAPNSNHIPFQVHGWSMF